MNKKVFVIHLREEINGGVEEDTIKGVYATREKAREVFESIFKEKFAEYNRDTLHEYDYKDEDSFKLENGFTCDYCVYCVITEHTIEGITEFPIAVLMREDLEDYGYDISKISDDDIEMVASRMGKYYSEGYADTFKSDLEIAACYYELPEKED